MVLNQELKSSSGLSFISKLYIWSIIFEPLLFFVVLDQATTGVSGNISKLIQFLVVVILFLKLLIPNIKVGIPNPFSKYFRYYTYYFILVIIAGLIGIFQGAYVFKDVYEKQKEFSALSQILNGEYIRPIFEYIITFYYFVYFAVLPLYLIKTVKGLEYFFKVFIRVFILGLVLGYIDLFLVSTLNIEWIPRHLVDGRHPGPRWHGLAGEPRDAFVYLMLGLGIINLYQYWKKKEIISRNWMILLFVTLLLTQSASGLLGFLFSGILIFLFTGGRFSFVKAFKLIMTIVLLVGVVYLGAINSRRIGMYLELFPLVWEAIGNGQEIPKMFIGQMSNIYPLWDLYDKLINYNFLPIIFGSGLGSASVVSNRIGNVSELYNPHSQLVRLLYESGLAGVLLFVYAFLDPVRRLTKSIEPKAQRAFVLILLLLLGAFFGHRSSALFIYLGIFILVFKTIQQGGNELPGIHKK